MSKYLAIDSNALTYLLEAVQEGYNPAVDSPLLAVERVSMIRLFLYGECSFWVSPTVRAEYRRISQTAWRETHERWVGFLLQDQPLKVPELLLQARANELMRVHPKLNDCRVVAEAEHSGLTELLSCDTTMLSRLRNHAKVCVLRPSELLESLNLQPGMEPVVRPADGNPLALQPWWRL